MGFGLFDYFEQEKTKEATSLPAATIQEKPLLSAAEQDYINKRAERAKMQGQDLASVENLKSNIRKSIKTAENPFKIIEMMSQVISIYSGEKGFKNAIMDDITAIYGDCLNVEDVMQIERENTSGRLEMLQSALEKESDKTKRERIRSAIKAHMEILKNTL